MIKRINIYLRLLALIFFAIPLNVKAQEDSIFRFDKKLEYPVSSFTVGNLGELYVINTNNQLKKYDEKGDSVGVFNQVSRHGKLAYVEAQNPWKVILFYKNFSTIVLLDKYLQVFGKINLRQQNIFGVNAVTTSYDNNIWLFDEQDYKLKKINDAGKILFESVDFRLPFDSVPAPVNIIDKDGFLYLYDPEMGIYIFDYYGSFKNRLPFFNWTSMAVLDNTIYGFDSANIYKYKPPIPEVKTYPLPPALQNASAIKMMNYKVYALKNKNLVIYSLQ